MHVTVPFTPVEEAAQVTCLSVCTCVPVSSAAWQWLQPPFILLRGAARCE